MTFSQYLYFVIFSYSVLPATTLDITDYMTYSKFKNCITKYFAIKKPLRVTFILKEASHD